MIGGAAPAPERPFKSDPFVASRMAELAEQVGPAVERDIAAIVAAPTSDTLAGSTLSAAHAAELIERHGLASASELALLALPVAAGMARPPISGFRVPAVGIEVESGDLVLGGNLEFPGTELWTTIHAEGFVALRVRRRGHSLGILAVREAHPCAHCRQTLAESAAADSLAIVDPLGHELRLLDLYPWPFLPSALGVESDTPSRTAWPNLAFVPGSAATGMPPPDACAALLAAGTHAHAPYSGAPSAAVLRLRDGRLLGAGCVESVAFNPSISALQAALVELAAAGVDASDVSEGWLARTEEGAVDPEPGFRALLGAVALQATASVVAWRP